MILNKRSGCFIAFLLIIFSFLFPADIFADRSDLNGVWIGRKIIDDVIVIETITISDTELIMTLEWVEGNFVIDSVNLNSVITLIEEQFNADHATRLHFPNGYLIQARNIRPDAPAEIFSLELYLTRNRRQFTIPQVNSEMGEVVIYRKRLN